MAVKSTKTKKSTSKSVKKPSLSIPKKINTPNQIQFSSKMLDVNANKLRVLAIIVLVLAFLILRRDLFIAATVNGEPISRFSVIADLEKQNGKATLDNIVTKKLITQEAKNRNLNVQQKEIDDELKQIDTNVKAQGMTLDQALEAQSMTKEQLISEIEIQLLLEKMVQNKVKVTKEEIEKFVTDNKDQFPAETTQEELNKQAEEQLIAQKGQAERQKLIEELQKKAKINTFVSY